MRFRHVAPGLWMASKLGVNVCLIEHEDALVLIDSGTPAMADPILDAVAAETSLAGKSLESVVLTHGHYDHAGGAAEVTRASGAGVWMHPADAALVGEGRWRRPARPSPTWHGRVLTAFVAERYPEHLPPVAGSSPIEDTLPLAGGLDTLPVPGHCAGQVALRWTGPDGGRTVFAGDTVMNLLGPSEPILYENRSEGLRSIGELATFAKGADRIIPGHGRPMRVSNDLIRRLERLAARASRR